MFLAAGVRRLRRGRLPPVHARLLQGAAVPGLRLGDPRDGRRAGHAEDGRPRSRRSRSPSGTFAVGTAAIAGVPFLSGFYSKEEILAGDARRGRARPVAARRRPLHRRADRVLHDAPVRAHVPGPLPRRPRDRAPRARVAVEHAGAAVPAGGGLDRGRVPLAASTCPASCGPCFRLPEERGAPRRLADAGRVAGGVLRHRHSPRSCTRCTREVPERLAAPLPRRVPCPGGEVRLRRRVRLASRAAWSWAGARSCCGSSIDAAVIDRAVNGTGELVAAASRRVRLLQSGAGARIRAAHPGGDGGPARLPDVAAMSEPAADGARVPAGGGRHPGARWCRARRVRAQKLLGLGMTGLVFLLSLVLVRDFQPRAGHAVRGRARLAAVARHLVPRGRRRHQHVAGDADHVPDADRAAGLLVVHHRPRARVQRVHAAAGSGHDRRVRLAGPVPLLHLLGSDADPDVLPDRDLGARAAHLRRREVLPLHDGRQRADAGGVPGALPRQRALRPSTSWRWPRQPGRPGAADVAVRGLRAGLRHQGADVAVPHLAARRARGGAHRRLGDPGGRAAEDGRLRLPAARHPALPGRGRRASRPGSACWR